LGPGDQDLDNDGEPDRDSKLSLHRPAAPRRTRFVGRRRLGGLLLSRSIFASLSVPRLAANYHVRARERRVRAVIFCGHTGCHKRFKRHTDQALFRDSRL
jgi:hypothetical protein